MKILKQELIGAHVRIAHATAKQLIGLEGTIIDETKNTLKIKTTKGVKTILKKGAFLNVGQLIIDGSFLVGRPEERIKK